MKTASLLAITAALFLSVSPVAFAQTTGVGAAVDLSLDANADGTVDADEQAAGVTVDADANAEVDLSLDTNADGTVDETEAAGSAGTDMSLDTDGDGVVSEAETAAGAELSATEVCDSVDFSAMTTAMADQAAAVSAATSAQVLRLTDCEDGTVSSLSEDVLAAVSGNAAITRVLEQETVGAGEILAITVDKQSVTIYVRDDDDSGENATVAQ